MVAEVVNYIVAKYFCESEECISRQKLMRLAFLCFRELKKRGLTEGVEFYLYILGPYSCKVEDAVNNLIEKDLLKLEAWLVEDRIVYYVCPTARSMLSAMRFESKNPEIAKIIHEVVEKFGRLSLAELNERIFSLEEVREAKFGDVILL